MAEVIFYRQMRRDGGVRTAIELSGRTEFHRFVDGDADTDPGLLWYVDVKCSGRLVPAAPELARQWLLANGPAIARELGALAGEVSAGIDPGSWPKQKTFRIGNGIRGEISCSAVRRVEAKKIGPILRDIARHWTTWIEDLAAYQPQ